MRLTRPGAVRFMLVASALVLGGLAQHLIANGSFRWAMTPYLVAVAAIAFASANRPLSSFDPRRMRKGPSGGLDTASAEHHLRDQDSPPARPYPRASAFERLAAPATIVISLLALFVALRRFAAGPPNTVAWYSFAASVILLLVALPSLESRWTALARRLRERPQVSFDIRALLPWAVLAAILALALAVRVYHLDELPAGLWFDEADNLVKARQIERDPGSAPVYVKSTNLPSLFLMPIAAVIELTGVTITAGRLVSVGFGLAGIVAVFLLVRLMLGPWLGLVAAFLTAVMRWDVNWSRIGMHGITAPLFAALAAYLTLRALRSGRASDFGYAGAALGLGMWFYTSFRMYPLVIGFMLLHHLVFRRPGTRRFVSNVLVMGAVALVVAAPVLQSAVLDSEEFFARTRTTSVFSFMPFRDAVPQIRESLGEHALMFNYKGDPNPRHNLPYEPMLDFGSGMLFLLGLGLALGRWRDVALVSMPFWVFFMVLPGVLTVPWESPQSLRSITVIPAVVVIITLVFGVVWRAGRSAPWPVVRRATPVAVAALLGWIAFLNINTYFGEQARNPDVYASFSTDEKLMGQDMVQQQRRGYTLFTSRQFMFGLSTSLVGHHPRYETIRAPTGIPIDAARVWKGVAVYLEPREASVYRLLKTYYPDGQFTQVEPPGGGDVLYYSAVMSREQLGRRQGLTARYTLPDGSVREVTESVTERAWVMDFDPEDTPFDLEWRGALHVTQPGEYVLSLEGDTEAVVILDTRPVLHPGRKTVRVELAVGLHWLTVQGRVEDRAGFLRLLWQPPGGKPQPIPANNLYHGSVRPVGLAGWFYGAEAEGEVADAMRVTPAMDTFYYDPVIPKPYLAVWRGELDVPETGEYKFKVSGEGTVRLFLDDVLRAQHPRGGSIGPSAGVDLEAGKRRVRVEYRAGGSRFEVLWAPPGRGIEPIPIERLSPAPERMLRVLSADE